MTSDKTVVEEMARAIRAAIDASDHLAAGPRDVGEEYHGEQRTMLYVDGAFDLGDAAQACAAVAAKRIEELEAALEATIPALEGQIETLFGSYRNLVGSNKGKVTDPDGLAWIAEFQGPLDIARAALSHRTGG
jgi:hypothetical protein